MSEYELQQNIQELSIKNGRLESYNAYLQGQLQKYRKELHDQSILVIAMKEERNIKWKSFALIKSIKARIELNKNCEKLQRDCNRLQQQLAECKEREILEECSIRG